MRLTVLGGCGAWPEAGRACSGYLVEYEGFRLEAAASAYDGPICVAAPGLVIDL